MSAIDVYEAYLEELRRTSEFFRKAIGLRSILPSMIDKGEPYSSGLIKEFSSAKFTEERIYQSFLVSAHAGFEQFIISLHEDACIRINNKNLPASKLESLLPGVLSKFRRTSGLALTKIFEPRSYWKMDYEQLVDALGSTSTLSNKTKIVGKVFIVDAGPLDGKGLENRLATFGFTLDWNKVGNDQEIANSLRLTPAAATGRAAKLLLDDLCGKRNALAHSQGSLSISASSFDELMSFYSAFATHISKSLLNFVEQKLK